MQPDPQRQWFVYFNEKELGPFSEKDVQKKLAAGELNQTAYLFTEGMADWALVDDVEVFKIQQSAPQEKTAPTDKDKKWEPKKLDSSTAHFDSSEGQFTQSNAKALKTQTGVKQSADPTVRGQTNVRGTNVRKKLELAPASKKKKIATVLLAVLAVALGYLIYQDKKDSFTMDALTGAKETVSNKTPSKSTEGSLANAVSGGDLNWKELESLRESQDPSSPPFRIASGNLGGERPIIVGVVSSMIKTEQVFVAVYSDNEKSLNAIPKIWFLESPVIEGYFTVGPLSHEGKALTPGTYHVGIAANGNYLGDVSFQQGTWPSDQNLADIQKRIQSERTLLAEREISSLNEKLQEMMAAYTQLEIIGKVAMLGPKKASEWKNKSSAWKNILGSALEDQRSSLAGPMFYAEAQQRLYNFMSAMMKHFEALDMNAKEGPAFLAKVKGKNLSQLWAGLKEDRDALNNDIQAALKNPPGSLKIDAEIVKNRIVEMSK